MSHTPQLVAVRPAPVSSTSASSAQVSGSTPPAEPGTMTQGALALQFQVAPGVPAVPAVPALRLVASRDATPPAAGDLPDVQAWSGRLVQAIAEVIAGDRPIGQLIRWTDSEVYAELNRRVRLLGLTTTAGSRGAHRRAQVRSVHISAPAAHVAEVAAHVRHGGRSRAVALRLEVQRNRWVCTALELG
ncbi:MAG TPA: Rv3235 family protein [Kribbellaceae bacterium]